MRAECLRIADQFRRAFNGDPWHGSPLRDLLTGITPEQARARPLPAAHNIWELVLHIEIYVRVALDATQGIAMPRLFGTEQDWPALPENTAEWATAIDRLFQSAEQLAQAIEVFDDSRLEDIAPGRQYDFYYLLHGIVQHSLYHGGQIALLKKG
jgi:hypothetical protein